MRKGINHAADVRSRARRMVGVAVLAEKLMRTLPLMALAIATASVLAEERDVFAYGRCQQLSPNDKARAQAMDLSMNQQSAEKASLELQRRIQSPLLDAPALRPSNDRLLAIIRGWLLKKDLLSSRARREHDADEGVTYCDFVLSEAGIDDGHD